MSKARNLQILSKLANFINATKTELIFVDPGLKVNGQYYRDVSLSQQMLPSIKRVAGEWRHV